MQKGKIRDTPERALSGHFAIRIHSPVENCCQCPLNRHPARVLHWPASFYLPRSCVSASFYLPRSMCVLHMHVHCATHAHTQTHTQYPGPPAYPFCPGCCPAQFGIARPVQKVQKYTGPDLLIKVFSVTQTLGSIFPMRSDRK